MKKRSRVDGIYQNKFSANQDKLSLKYSPEILITLADWATFGIMIHASVQGIGSCYFNDEVYPNMDAATKDYEKIVEQVEKGKYSIELYDKGIMKLRITV